jgi:hypothetical protein
MVVLVDAVEDAVGAASRAVAIVERRAQASTYALRILQQRADDEFVSRKGYWLWKLLSELPTCGWGNQ